LVCRLPELRAGSARRAERKFGAPESQGIANHPYLDASKPTIGLIIQFTLQFQSPLP
jgi:hypothetical protein